MAGHDVRYRELMVVLSDLPCRLHAARKIAPVRERNAFEREPIERLPELRVSSHTGRSIRRLDVKACHGRSKASVSPGKRSVRAACGR